MSLLHDPFNAATPSQVYAAAAHRDRMKRIYNASRAFAPAVEKMVFPPIPAEEIKLACEITTLKTYGQVETIQRAVVNFFPAVTLVDINSNRRTAKVVKPRQIAMYLVKTLTSRSFPDIGRRFGDRDHTTVIHAVRKIERLIAVDPVLASAVAEITNSLGVS